MEVRLPIHSRRANQVLLLLGILFLVASSAILIYAVSSTWGYAGFTDRALQGVLLGCAAFGALLAIGAWTNLRGSRYRRA